MEDDLHELITHLRFCDSNIINIFVYTSIINKKSNLIDKLDIKKYKKCKADDIECCICYSNISKSEYIRELNCNHAFHKKCIDKWLLISMKEKEIISCPICRTTINIK